MKIRSLFVGVAVMTIVLVSVAPSLHAATGATCAASAGVSLSPGITMKPSSGTFASLSGGTLACVGAVKGIAVAGPGSVSFSGTYGPGDTCAKGKGSGTISARLHKAAGGTLSASGTFTFTRVGSDVVVQGKLAGARLAGNLQFVPKQSQNCVKTKVTRATVSGAAISIG